MAFAPEDLSISPRPSTFKGATQISVNSANANDNNRVWDKYVSVPMHFDSSQSICSNYKTLLLDILLFCRQYHQGVCAESPPVTGEGGVG